VADGTIAEARIALGGVAAKPWRAVRAEAALRGLPPIRENFLAAAEKELAAAKALAGNAFKIGVAQRTIVSVLESLAGEPA
jgi:xanthine dehydrogenase YagS FAD-binding subunit